MWCGFACLEWGKAYVDTIIRFSTEVSLWFEEEPVSEVVFRFDVGHVHHHLHLPLSASQTLSNIGTDVHQDW